MHGALDPCIHKKCYVKNNSHLSNSSVFKGKLECRMSMGLILQGGMILSEEHRENVKELLLMLGNVLCGVHYSH